MRINDSLTDAFDVTDVTSHEGLRVEPTNCSLNTILTNYAPFHYRSGLRSQPVIPRIFTWWPLTNMQPKRA